MTKILMISSIGGHLEQLLSLKKVIKEYEPMIVTERNAMTTNLSENNKLIKLIPYISRKNFISFFIALIYCTFESFKIFNNYKPNLIISTGSGCALPMCLIAKISGKKIIFIETFSRVKSKTLTGRICYYFADYFIVQWNDLTKIYPRAVFLGHIY